MYKAEIDLAVLLIFFARPNTLEKTFEKIKRARPSKLFLACDGPREKRESDLENIAKCKQIVSDIDWECEVYEKYSNENQGCGKGPRNAISWAFSYVDRLLIIEDDCVADDTLFPYMKEMLDRYENDERIGMISGFNHTKSWDCGGFSYCFTKTGATLGWGTWRRVWEKYDYYVESIKNKYYQKLLVGEFPNYRIAKRRISGWETAAEETVNQKVNYWDIQFGFLKYSQSYLCAVPKYNLICNIGVGAGSTHTESSGVEKWRKGKVLFMPTEPLEFPLSHPSVIICDRQYDTETMKIIFPSKAKKILGKVRRIIGK